MYHYPLQYDVLLDLYIVVLNRALIWSKLDIFISAQRAASGDLSRDNYYILEICILLYMESIGMCYGRRHRVL